MSTTLSIGGGATAGQSDSEGFPDPFLDMASTAMPETIQEALRWEEFIVMANGPYREALSRIVSYFITDIEIDAAPGGRRLDREEKQKYLDFFNDTLGIRDTISAVALDYLTYGNSFTSLLVPFRRFLACPKCEVELPLRQVYNNPEFAFKWSNFEFHAHCPKCKYQGEWRHIDRRSGERDAVRIKRWNPHDIELLWDPHTDEVGIIWNIPDDYRALIRKGHLFHLERASWEIVQAVKRNQSLLFDPDVVHHMKAPGLSGVRGRGWGVSRVLSNFRQAWYYQILHRYNEAIALDYVIPFRVITPMPRPGQSGEINDPVLSSNLGNFTGRVNSMLRARRRDPARWNVLPYPIEYKALGGDATKLAPKDLLEQALDTLLNSIGIPAELYRGTLSIQAALGALRAFEAQWVHLVHNLNSLLNKQGERISQLMSWEPVVVRLQRVTHADDLNRQMARLQLMMGGQISKTTGLESVGLTFAGETSRMLEEERLSAEAQQEQQEELEQSAQMDLMTLPPQAQQAGGMPPPGGVTGQPAGVPAQTPGAAPLGPMGVPQGPQGAAQLYGAQAGTQSTDTPELLMQKAQVLAEQILAMPESQKDSTLIQLKHSDPTLHALVRSVIEEQRRQNESEGRALVEEQKYGKRATRALQL